MKRLLLGLLLLIAPPLLHAQGNIKEYRKIASITARSVNDNGDSIIHQYTFSYSPTGRLEKAAWTRTHGLSTTSDSISITAEKRNVILNNGEIEILLTRKGLAENTTGTTASKVLLPLANATPTYDKGKLITLDAQDQNAYYQYGWNAQNNITSITKNGLPIFNAKYTNRENNVFPYFNGIIEPANFLDHLFARRSQHWVESINQPGKFKSHILHEIRYDYTFDKKGDPIRILETNPYGVTKKTEITIHYLR